MNEILIFFKIVLGIQHTYSTEFSIDQSTHEASFNMVYVFDILHTPKSYNWDMFLFRKKEKV